MILSGGFELCIKMCFAINGSNTIRKDYRITKNKTQQETQRTQFCLWIDNKKKALGTKKIYQLRENVFNHIGTIKMTSRRHFYGIYFQVHIFYLWHPNVFCWKVLDYNNNNNNNDNNNQTKKKALGSVTYTSLPHRCSSANCSQHLDKTKEIYNRY